MDGPGTKATRIGTPVKLVFCLLVIGTILLALSRGLILIAGGLIGFFAVLLFQLSYYLEQSIYIAAAGWFAWQVVNCRRTNLAFVLAALLLVLSATVSELLSQFLDSLLELPAFFPVLFSAMRNAITTFTMDFAAIFLLSKLTGLVLSLRGQTVSARRLTPLDIMLVTGLIAISMALMQMDNDSREEYSVVFLALGLTGTALFALGATGLGIAIAARRSWLGWLGFFTSMLGYAGATHVAFGYMASRDKLFAVQPFWLTLLYASSSWIVFAVLVISLRYSGVDFVLTRRLQPAPNDTSEARNGAPA
ncbi:MAG TPA: hypothetical protein DDW52_21030 [Planctomycetaceae bacterium]|nr:hypothetical protein [Planctomycetaceae bacterium]